MRAYVALQNAHAKRPVHAPMLASQPVSSRYQLIMGGWDHGNGLDMGLYLQWLDTWLKGRDTGLQNTCTPMHLFEQGTNRWVNLSGYPQIDATRFRLGQGTLGSRQSTGQETLRYAQPSAALGRTSHLSPPFAQGATLSGAISATLYARSSTPNLVFIAHLYDVAPDGSEQLVSRGALLGSRRALNQQKSWTDRHGVVLYPWHGFGKDTPLKPGEINRFDLSLNTRQWGIRPGHRLRLELTTQTPTAECPDKGVPARNDIAPCRLNEAQQTTLKHGVFTLLYGRDTPSSLNLPLLAYRAQPEVRAGRLALPWNEGARRLEVGDVESRPEAANLLPMDRSITHPLVW